MDRRATMNQLERVQGIEPGDARRIILYRPEDFVFMRRAGQLAAATLDMIAEHVRPGVTTEALDRLCHGFILDHGAVPAPLGYRGFPKSICTSVNHVVCHGIPASEESDYFSANEKMIRTNGLRVKLREGDILNIDVTVVLDGWHGDSSRMYVAGEPSVKAQRLMDVTHDAMMLGIKTIRPGATLGDLGHAIQSYVERHGYSVVREFCGHGLGRAFHEPPNVLHFGRPGEGVALREGMLFTVEPMVNAGRPEVKILDDGWTAVTRDRSLSAQFEHTVGVTATGCEIFTLSPAGLHKPPYA
jgi:methionyl aminopeptidase